MDKLFSHPIFLGIFFLNIVVNGYATPVEPPNSIPFTPRHVLFGSSKKTAASTTEKRLADLAPYNEQAPMNIFDNVLLDVVYIPQNDMKSCATTSVAMAISYYEKLNDKPLNKETVWNISGSDEGTVRHFGNDMEGLERIASHYGYKSRFITHMEVSDIEHLLSGGTLVMLNIMGSKQTSPNHAVLVIGYDRISSVFYINDPADRQNRILKYSDLETRWFAHLSSPMGLFYRSGFIIYPNKLKNWLYSKKSDSTFFLKIFLGKCFASEQIIK